MAKASCTFPGRPNAYPEWKNSIPPATTGPAPSMEPSAASGRHAAGSEAEGAGY
jgi:hypothetical protein